MNTVNGKGNAWIIKRINERKKAVLNENAIKIDKIILVKRKENYENN